MALLRSEMAMTLALRSSRSRAVWEPTLPKPWMATVAPFMDPADVLTSERLRAYKPHPEIYLEACRRMAADPHEVLMVAGSPYDALGARRVTGGGEAQLAATPWMFFVPGATLFIL